ncbi:MAG: hypothetical protein HUU48_07135 [Flavobacteriales bacterium]|nr:hypothetical protein [Flavobacteriales bacterium]
MATRNYPSKRKFAGLWECPICKKSINIRGKSGHLKFVHDQFLLSKKHDPFPTIERPIVSYDIPFEEADVKNLLLNLTLIASKEIPNDLLSKRKTYLKMEYYIREFEIKYTCTLENAFKKFPELK